MEDKTPKKREKILSLVPRMREIAEKNKSNQLNEESTKQIITEMVLPYNNFHNFFTVINHSNQTELKNSFYYDAVRYAKLRSDWILADHEQRIQMEDERKSSHNVFIDSCNILSRNMTKNGEDASWRKELGDDRKVIGDFACYINFTLGIKAR